MERLEPGMRINKGVLKRFYDVERRRAGSLRKVAEGIGISHTQLANMLDDPKKTHVNIETARRCEEYFGVPRGVIFVAEVLPVTSSGKRAA